MQPIHDQTVAVLQAAGDQPLTTHGAFGDHIHFFHRVVVGDEHGAGLASRVTGNAFLGNQNGIFSLAFREATADEHTRQQIAVRVGEERAQGHRAGAFVYCVFGELQGTGFAVLAAVFQDQGDTCFIVADLLQFAGFHGLTQAAQLDAGLGQIHIDGVQLADGCQGIGLVGGDQGAGRHGGTPDAAADRRFDGGVIQVDLCALQIGPGGGHSGLVFIQGGFGFVIFLLADRAAFQQRLEAFHTQGVGVQGGLGSSQLRPGRSYGCLVGA